MPRNIIYSDVSMDPESKSEAVSIAPEAEDEPEEDEEGAEGEREGRREGEDEDEDGDGDGDERKEGDKGDDVEEEGEEVDEPERSPPMTTRCRRCVAHTVVTVAPQLHQTINIPFKQSDLDEMNTLRPRSPRHRRRQPPRARRSSRSRSSWPHKLRSPLAHPTPFTRTKTLTATSN
jgi:hypothetical protein